MSIVCILCSLLCTLVIQVISHAGLIVFECCSFVIQPYHLHQSYALIIRSYMLWAMHAWSGIYACLCEISWGSLVALMCLFQNTSQSTSTAVCFKMKYIWVYLYLFLLNNCFITFICLASPLQSLASPTNYRHVLQLGTTAGMMRTSTNLNVRAM